MFIYLHLGHYYLVLMVDTLHAAVTEPMRCDNHVTFEFDFECPNATSQAGIASGNVFLVLYALSV